MADGSLSISAAFQAISIWIAERRLVSTPPLWFSVPTRRP